MSPEYPPLEKVCCFFSVVRRAGSRWTTGNITGALHLGVVWEMFCATHIYAPLALGGGWDEVKGVLKKGLQVDKGVEQ